MPGRIIAIVLLLAAAIAAAAEIVRSFDQGRYDVFSAADVWLLAHRGSMTAVEKVIVDFIAPWAWDSVILKILSLPAWLLAGAPALLVLWRAEPPSRNRVVPNSDASKRKRLAGMMAENNRRGGAG
jgi:hypothetical protein